MSVQNVQVKAQEYLNTLDKELGKSFYANELERRTGVPKTYFVLGAGAITFIMIFFNLAGQLLTNTISWIYPGKYTFFLKNNNTKYKIMIRVRGERGEITYTKIVLILKEKRRG